MAQRRSNPETPIASAGPLYPVRLPTEAEARVLELVALGLTSQEIADRLWISRQGVTYHIGNLFRKLRADTRAGLVSRAYATGLLEPGRWPPQASLRHVGREQLPQVSPSPVDPHRERSG
jgi:DNA-binding CsgD family transcriptional regulator